MWKRTAFLSREYRRYPSLLLVMSKTLNLKNITFKIDQNTNLGLVGVLILCGTRCEGGTESVRELIGSKSWYISGEDAET